MRIAAIVAAFSVLSMVPPNDSDRIIAWSKDGLSFAVRSERTLEIAGNEPGEEQGVQLLAINVFACGKPKPVKAFEVTTEKDYSKSQRARGWKKAESWLKQQGYVFVAGDSAQAVEVPLTDSGLGKGSGNLMVIELPSNLGVTPRQRGNSNLQVRPANTKDESSKDLLVELVRETEDHTVVHDARIAKFETSAMFGVSNWTCEQVSYGPGGACAAFQCNEPAPMAGTFSHVFSVKMSDVAAALKKMP